ncbi:MAG: DUF421 domain-containing protein [Clostridia bacterium]|nr:DUF421 domain-containing protein [Clostridia bacterium]
MLVGVMRCIILYCAVIVAVRIMGKRQIGELQPSELVVTIMMSELAALPLQDLNIPLVWGIIPMFLMAALELLMSFFTLKSLRFRAFFYGRPVLLIYQGKIHQNELLRTRVSMEDIMEAMRGSGILAIEDIQMAVLETNGTLSIIPKPQMAPPTAKDMNIPVADSGGIPAIIVMDGHCVDRNMKMKGVDHKQLAGILKGYQVLLKDVFMLTIDDKGKTFLVKRDLA